MHVKLVGQTLFAWDGFACVSLNSGMIALVGCMLSVESSR